MPFWKKEKPAEVPLKTSDFDPKLLWLRGFEEGFRCAWNWMAPYMQEAKEEVRKKCYEKAMEKALQDLEPTVKRLEEIGYQIR